ncbi:hypothetical protein MH1LPH_17720 [Lactiplantibacillus brownii]
MNIILNNINIRIPKPELIPTSEKNKDNTIIKTNAATPVKHIILKKSGEIISFKKFDICRLKV